MMEKTRTQWGNYWYCPGDSQEVLRFLQAGAGLPYRMTPVSPYSVIFETKGSFFADGESLEVIVRSLAAGCSLLFRATDGTPVNPVGDPKGVAARVASAVGVHFGALTPTG